MMCPLWLWQTRLSPDVCLEALRPASVTLRLEGLSTLYRELGSCRPLSVQNREPAWTPRSGWTQQLAVRLDPMRRTGSWGYITATSGGDGGEQRKTVDDTQKGQSYEAGEGNGVGSPLAPIRPFQSLKTLMTSQWRHGGYEFELKL